MKELGFDTETNGRDIYGKSEVVGWSCYLPDGTSFYMAHGHLQGTNRDPDHCRQWALDNLRDKKLVMAESKFDIHGMRKFGVPFEDMGCTVHEIQYDQALLDSRRRSYGLDDMAFDHLKKQKVRFPNDGLRIHERRAEDVDEYARIDAQLTYELKQFFAPLIEAQELGRVQKLENDLIWSTSYMERSGLKIDMERLYSFSMIVRQRYQALINELERLVGFRVIPSKRDHRVALFKKLGLEIAYTEEGTPSFTSEYLQTFWHPKHLKVPKPVLPVKLLNLAIMLDSLESKYFTKYAEAVDDDGCIRFKLHQLKASNEEDGSNGTVTGRYSTSGGRAEDGSRRGFNPQQVFKAEQQLEHEIMRDLLVKSLFVAPEGMRFFSTDASQIEYRLFGHYVNSPSVTKVYQANPWADFHEQVALMTDLERKDAKHANFAALYGAQLKKFAYMIDKSVEDAKPIYNRYHRQFPEVNEFHEYAMKLAETRGYVKTLLGRRRRFGEGVDTKYHAAVNAVIQGTAADVNKLAVLDLYNNRKDLGVDLRLTFHDEELGYGYFQSEKECQRMYEFMNEQRIDSSVPILWNLVIDDDWAMQNPIWKAEKGVVTSNFKEAE